MAATATVQSRSKSLFPIPMPSFKGTGSIRSFTRAASPAPSTNSHGDDAQGRSLSPAAFYATGPSSAAGSASSIKSGRSLTGSLLSMRSLGRIASFGGRLGARARPAHPPPETFTYLKDLVLVDEPEDMDLRCGGEEHVGVPKRENGSEGGAYWGRRVSDDDGETQGSAHPPPHFSSSPHDDRPTPDDMPTRTHTLPSGAAAPEPSTSRTASGNMNTATNTTTPSANADASTSGPAASASTNPLQRPRSKSRTIIRMLTTKFSHPSSPSSSNGAQPSANSTQPSTSPAHALHLKIPLPKAPKPKAPPKAAPTAFADPAARAAALRARGLLPPLPVLDLSEQERARDARLPILEPESGSREHSRERAEGDAPGQERGTGTGNGTGTGSESGEQGETAADRIKREWAARHGIEISSTSAAPVRDDVAVVEAQEAGANAPEAESSADPQRARMRAFKFGGSGSTPPTPTVESAAALMQAAKSQTEAVPVQEPVTPIGLDIDVSLIDFSEPAPAAAPAAAVKPTVETASPAPVFLIDAAPIITAADVEGSTSTAVEAEATIPITAPAPPAAHAVGGSTAPKAEAETETVKSISIEITPPEATLTAPITAAVPPADDSDNAGEIGADKNPGAGDDSSRVGPGSSAAEEEAQVPVKSENAVAGSVPPRALPALPTSGTRNVEEDASSPLDSQLAAALPADQESTMSDVVAVSGLVPGPTEARTEQGTGGERDALVKVNADAEVTSTSSLPSSSTPPTSTETAPRTVPTPPTSPLLRTAFSQVPPASPPPMRDLPPIPGATVRLLPSLPAPTSSSPPTSTLTITTNESKYLQPVPMVFSLSSDTQTSAESDDSTESSNSGSTTESAPIVTPVTPAFARSSNNPFADPSDANGAPRVAKGKLGTLSVKTQGGLGGAGLPVLVHSPAAESMQGVPLEVVHEESHDAGGWLDSRATTPAAVPAERNPADELLESMGLDKGAFSRGLVEDNSLSLGLGLDTTSAGTEPVVPTSPLVPLTPLSPNRVPSVTISTPSTGAPPRNKKRGMTDPGAPERRKSLFGGFRKGDGAVANEGGDGAPQRRVSVVASLGNLRRSVVGTISGAEKRERDKKAASRSRSPRRFDASHLPPSPSPFTGFQTANANMNDAYRNDGMPGSPRTTSSHGSGSALSHGHSNHSKTVLAPGSAPQLRRSTAPSSQVQRRTAVEPVMYSRGSILLETANIEDEETRRMTEMAFLG